MNKLRSKAEDIVADAFENAENFPPTTKEIREAITRAVVNMSLVGHDVEDLMYEEDIQYTQFDVETYGIEDVSPHELAGHVLKKVLLATALEQIDDFMEIVKVQQEDWQVVLNAANKLGIAATYWKPHNDFQFLHTVQKNVYDFAEAVGEVCEYEGDLLSPEYNNSLLHVYDTRLVAIGLPTDGKWCELHSDLLDLTIALTHYLNEYGEYDSAYMQDLRWQTIEKYHRAIPDLSLCKNDEKLVNKYIKDLENMIYRLREYAREF